MDEKKEKRRLKTKVIDGITVNAETKSTVDETRDTVGTIASDLLLKSPETDSPIEQMREQLTDYDKSLAECIDKALLTHPGDFYVVVISKKERLLENVLRCYFFSRKTCPTPEWDQTVYKYHRLSGPEFLWVVPSKDTCELFMRSAPYIVLEERGLLNFVQQFTDGTLMKIAKSLNGEAPDSPLIIA
jgi:hypothetical protein